MSTTRQMGGWQQIANTFAPALDLVYPPRCPVCGDAIGEQAGLCAQCWSGLEIPSEPACSLCQRPFGSDGPQAGAQCAPCMAKAPRHDGIAAGTLYNDISRRRIALAPMLARLMAARLSGNRDAVLVPVPLHRWRLWRRGFNQAALLARELERLGEGALLVDGLIRKQATPSLGGMGASARRRTLSGAIVANPAKAGRLAGADVVLVDDVLTSGATSDMCVSALKRAGAASVTVCCFSRVLSEGKGATSSFVAPKSETPETTKVPGAT